ncbi:Di-copper centre-containing protein [Conidiobolus coronatus NRRL 28638]|uniref:Di-copper centre-containing protein n=1 Tax=Conidiobolus coronatus (strain ATCC 28846 / CBS 209.66 / NRRL 28638) TaxID=796925 RepID=A0A137NQN3_CONC2|nr:Di-copper centre-containing protein [Conidiobolus coronatus NRRL 28638]|eukprot:KXN64980.1 Di-copper centre-containing protein [Conidiobolus coronatus NRRL 28638]
MLLINIIISLFSFQSVIGQSRCTQGNTKTRKNILNFSSEELRKWLDVTKKFSQTARFNELSKIHNDNNNYIHGKELFLPWHRKFLATYEDELLKMDSSVILPFVDWTTYSSSPHRHPIFQNNRYGGNGNRNNNWCLDSGTFARNTVTNPRRKCLQRRYDLNDNTELSSFSSKEEVQSAIDRSNRYTDFRRAVEGNIHNLPHYYIGDGEFDMATLHSPNDPLFYLHHAFIDRAWFQWQLKKESRFGEYNSNNERVSKNDRLVALGGIVGDVLDPRKGLCYQYESDTARTNMQSSLERSSVMSNNQTEFTTNLNLNIWDRIKAIPFNKESDEIPNIGKIPPGSGKCLIPKPGKLSPEFLGMMNIDYKEYEENRIMSVKVIQLLNSDPGYKPAEGC